jgi:hypothetical protein
VVFSCPKPGRYFGLRLAGATHKEKPNQSGFGHCPRGRRSQCRRIARYTRRAGAITNAPEGGGTTQRGDPAPGPMRCGTTASGDERMHP